MRRHALAINSVLPALRVARSTVKDRRPNGFAALVRCVSAAWDRLLAASPRFRRLERTFSAVWGTTLIAECVVRVVCAYPVPVDTVVALSTGVLSAMVVGAFVLSGALAVAPVRLMAEEGAAKAAEAAKGVGGRRVPPAVSVRRGSPRVGSPCCSPFVRARTREVRPITAVAGWVLSPRGLRTKLS